MTPRKAKKRPARKPQCAASVHIHDAGRMTPQGRKDIALWLRRAGDHLVREGDNYAKRFNARYMY